MYGRSGYLGVKFQQGILCEYSCPSIPCSFDHLGIGAQYQKSGKFAIFVVEPLPHLYVPYDRSTSSFISICL